ncbi:folylpolyglutamate synthase [Coemansia sp. RSA 1200]|nr:folylpolyglutamate synthase [Coemansia sp. RSA 1200]
MAASENPGRIKLGLERIIRFLESTLPTDPRTNLRVVHVAGTNGKGSVCALISEALHAAGYNTGTYNSPHFLHVNDAVRVNGAPVPAEEYAELRAWINKLDAATPSPNGPLSLFEQATVAALCWFDRNNVDIAVIEVGMGGLRDATNVFGPPEGKSSLGVGRSLVQCICSVDMDHVGMIGNTVEEIALEKIGIIRPGSWIVIARQDHVGAFHKIRQVAHKISPGHIINVRRQPACDLLVGNFSFSLEDNPDSRLRLPDPAPNWSIFNGTGKRCLHVKYPPSLDTYATSGSLSPSPSSSTASSQSAAKSGDRKHQQNGHQAQPSECAPICEPTPASDATDTSSRSIEADFPLVLPGSHQTGNACVAFYALDILRTYYGFTKLTDAAIQIGFQNVRWPGRLSWLRIGNADGSGTNSSSTSLSAQNTNTPSSRNSSGSSRIVDSLDEWILADGAHNEPAAAELRNYINTTLRRLAQQRYINTTTGKRHHFSEMIPVRWIVGFSRGKDMGSILKKLVHPGDTLWAVPFSQPEEMPWVKCEEPEDILACAKQTLSFEKDGDSFESAGFGSLPEVLDKLAESASDSTLNVLCGSLYLVSDLYRELQIQPFDEESERL